MSLGVAATVMPHSLKTAIFAAAVSPAPPKIALDSGNRMGLAPTFGGGAEGGFVFWPVVENRRIEIGAGRPDDGVNLGIETHSSKERGVAERTEEFAFENRLKIDGARQPVVEAQAQRVGCNKLERTDSVYRVVHVAGQLQHEGDKR